MTADDIVLVTGGMSRGFTRTAALEAGIASGAGQRRLARNTAMNRLVEPIEVAQAIAWLLRTNE